MMPGRLPREGATFVVLVLAALVGVGLAPGIRAQEVASDDADWRLLGPERTLYMWLPGGRVVIELAPEFAPEHVENIRTLVRERYFDGLAVIRVQDNYVTQWGDPDGERPFGSARAELEAELDRPIGELPFTPLPDGDLYAPEVGYSRGFPVARNPDTGRAWLVHCYGMVGVARDVEIGSGDGSQLYVVIGHSPRHLDLNTTMVGRVVRGMEHLSSLPRGSGRLGFYTADQSKPLIDRVRLGTELPAGERTELEVMRTDSEAFRNWIEARRTRTEEWFVAPGGRVSVCNVPVPSRDPAG